MSPESGFGDEEINRWEAVEAESRQQFEREAQAAESEGGPAVSWDVETPSWWQEAGGEQRPPAAATDVPGSTARGADESASDTAGGERPTVLVVDTDHVIGATIERALAARGWTVRRMVDAEQAIVELDRCKPDCVVFEYSMPGMSGLEFLRRLAGLDMPDTTRLVANSRQTQAIHVQRALVAGAHRFLERPRAEPDELVEAVAEQLAELGMGNGPADPSRRSTRTAPAAAPERRDDDRGAQAAKRYPDSTAPNGEVSPTPPDEPWPYRSAFGRGGGPPGRIPRLG